MNDIVERVWAKELSIEDMESLYKDQFSEEEALQELESAFLQKELRVLGNVFFFMFRLDLFSRIHIPILQQLLLENWHHEHENIVSLFQSPLSDAPGTIEVLLKALDQIPEYLEEEFYIRRIFYAIGAQPSPHNMETLLMLKSREQRPEILALLDEQINLHRQR